MKAFLRYLFGCVVATSGFQISVAHAAVGDHVGAIARGDFNNDGTEDVVVSSPQDDCGKGVIHIRSGAAVSSWTRDTAGILGAAACSQFFGTALAVGNFDNDAYDDLAVSAPGASDSGESQSGSVHIFYGGPGGLSTVGDQLWHQDTTGINGVAEVGDFLGDALTTGDFNCDGYSDIAIGVPREGISGKAEAGATHVFYGGPGGVTSVDDIWHQAVSGVNGTAEAGDHFGEALAAGNYNGDVSGTRPCDDLAIASPGEAIGAITEAGYLYIIDGGPSGLSTTGDQAFHQNSSAVEDTAEAGDRFGARLWAFDDNGDAYDDLAISVPGDACVPTVGEGTHVFLGSAGGLSTVDDRLVCNTYRCEVNADTYGCLSDSPAILGSSASETFALFVGDDELWAGDGDDTIRADYGDDVTFGGPGADLFKMGAGMDAAIGGQGDDTFELGLDCQAVAGKVIDGGPGADTIRSHFSQSQLVVAGVTLRSIESYVTIAEYASGDCEAYPIDEGATVPPKLELSWRKLPDPDDVFTSKDGSLQLDIDNTSGIDIDFDLTFRLIARGHVSEVEETTLALDKGKTAQHVFDLNDFIPAGIDPATLDPALFELPTSAVLIVEANMRQRGTSTIAGRAFAPTIWGHYESGDAVVYRADAYATTYFNGDLVAWRGTSKRYTGPHVLEGRIEARTVRVP